MPTDNNVPPPRGFLIRLSRWWRGFWKPRTIREHLIAFLGPKYDQFETHDKNYPGYDLASLHHALTSFLGECCSESKEIGACGAIHTMRELFESTRSVFTRIMVPGALTY